VAPPTRWTRVATLLVALALLNAAVTFENIWPTPMIRWSGALSIELAVGILALSIVSRRFGPPTRGAVYALTAVWLVLVIGHYGDVTAPALYGRDVNLYWDLRFIPDVTALLARAGPLWLVAVTALGLFLTMSLAYGLLRWAVARVAQAVAVRPERRAITGIAAAAALLFVTQTLSADRFHVVQFSRPVTETYAHQAWLVATALRRPATLAASPRMDSDLRRVQGADVFLIFFESYGAVTYDRPEFSRRLAASREQFAAAIRDTGRQAVSAYVESPTFGGSSWLAHISLMSGVEVRDPDTNALLMTQRRETMVTDFARHGYRTVALMPGLWQRWPEGTFYGFDEIYGGARLDYKGPEFGWFDMSDQFALARLDVLEKPAARRPPLFVFFPTISTHTPFTPTPPYQPDWPRVLTETPYDEAELEAAYARQPDWMDLGPSYVDAVAYGYTTFAGYLRQQQERDFIMILLGDHQPPALVSGPGAPWDVPVHVIASRADVLDRLIEHGFRRGIEPGRPSLGPMHTLLPLLLDAFGDREHRAVASSGDPKNDTAR
jgi:hypothetical protein